MVLSQAYSVFLHAFMVPLCSWTPSMNLFASSFVMREVYASSYVTSRGEDSHEGLIHTVNSLFEY